MEKLIAHRIVEDDAAPLPAAVVPAWRLKRRRRVKEVAESLVDQLLEARPTRVFDLISQMLKGTPGIEVVDTWTQADGMASLFKTEDGQAYEVQLRPAAYAKHPSIAQHYGTGRGAPLPVQRSIQRHHREHGVAEDDVVRRAREQGAKLHRRDDGRWVCLDMEGTPLWTLTFPTIQRAAEAYLIQKSKDTAERGR